MVWNDCQIPPSGAKTLDEVQPLVSATRVGEKRAKAGKDRAAGWRATSDVKVSVIGDKFTADLCAKRSGGR